MKKVVWSETTVEGGRTVRTVLPKPPAVAGPYQDVPAWMVMPGEPKIPPIYADIRVLAVPDTTTPLSIPTVTTSGGPVLSTATLQDGRFADAIILPFINGEAWVAYRYEHPQTIRSAIVGVPISSGFGTPNPPLAFLETSDDGQQWCRIVALPPTPSPALALPARTSSFAPVTSHWFRIRVVPDSRPGFVDHFSFAPGALRPPFPTGAPPNVPLSEFDLRPDARVNRAAEQAGFSPLPDYYQWATPPAVGIDPARIIDLTDQMSPDGTLSWTSPPGRWRVLRFGWSLTGHRNGPAPEEATGLEVDKLSAPRVGVYLESLLGMYRQSLGPEAFGPRGLTSLLSDSIEAGPQNWTETLPTEFARRRGYSSLPWLPCLVGFIVGDARRTDAFLYDWRKTIAELYADAHYRTIARTARDNNLTYYAEALKDHRPQLGDDVAIRARADVPMGAMWTVGPGAKPLPTYVADIKGAASAANLFGKPIVAAESMSALGHPWAYAPADLKATADLEFALGVNLIHIHESAHQPLADRPPGLALATFLGQYFNRNETWATMADGWISYLARTSYLLQQGRHAADIAYFYGEEAPLTSIYGDEPISNIAPGYDFDFVNADGLATRLSVQNGALVTPDNQRYRVLYLGGSSRRMTLASLRRVRDLLMAGATIVGKRPCASPSLADDSTEVNATIASIWDVGASGTFKGRLYADGDLAAALRSEGIKPDWTWKGEGEIAVIHRTDPRGDIWFISNRTGATVSGTLSIRGSGRVPELWHAETAEITPTSYAMADERSDIPLTLRKDDAVFVVMRRATLVQSAAVTEVKEQSVLTLDKGWRLSFQSGRGAPSGERECNLSSWTESKNPDIRYFSGIGSYRRSVRLPSDPLSARSRVFLELGDVREVAEVEVNGQRAGVAWKAPYRVEVTGLLKPGTNSVIVRVANLWVNRLIGDAVPGAKKIAFVTGPTYAANAPLRPSGLLGPVRIIVKRPSKPTATSHSRRIARDSGAASDVVANAASTSNAIPAPVCDSVDSRSTSSWWNFVAGNAGQRTSVISH